MTLRYCIDIYDYALVFKIVRASVFVHGLSYFLKLFSVEKIAVNVLRSSLVKLNNEDLSISTPQIESAFTL